MNSTAFYHCLISKLSVPQFLTHTFIFKLKISIAKLSKFLGSTKKSPFGIFFRKTQFPAVEHFTLFQRYEHHP